MPMYDFTCRNGHKFEAIVPTSSFETADCPECDQEGVKDETVPLTAWRNPAYGIQG